ncbi:precorrin 3B synthase CobZ [Purpureocillium lavendulum]|uniref:Precorrin 3B synthase CobZ n=1 Tax=Purpureocillium lavendulum TaxID=1247861 RepID=A0AB34G2E9_9HYPO|nr:precorrin 3B synthase CobZ [Purpureocillium lavendulum]
MANQVSVPSLAIPATCDVLVVGSGNAGFTAAISAVQAGAKHVLLIDKCPESWAGGNTYFTAGAYRTTHDGLPDLISIVNNVDKEVAENIELQPYTEADFHVDLAKVCGGRSDSHLANILVSDSHDTIKWLARQGIRFQLSFNRQSYEVDGKIKFWGGLSLKTEDGGKGLIADFRKAALSHDIKTLWNTSLADIVLPRRHGDDITAAVRRDGIVNVVKTRAIVLAAGGFESNSRMRSRFLGSDWAMAMVRGTPFNTGDCLEMAVSSLHAQPYGDWAGCHAVAWDANANPETGDRGASNEFTKSGYPLGLMVNVEGRRFVDEGADLRNYTYALYGRAILGQPEQCAFQVWDAQVSSMLRWEEYRAERVERITSDSIEGLAAKCASRGLRNRDSFIRTIQEYNQAVYANRKEHSSRPQIFDPAVRDGLSTFSSSKHVEPPKTNWALPLDKGPFLAVKVTCGITFTFGGLKVVPETAQVVRSRNGAPIPGVYCCGEMLGGLFYANYPGGSGLTSGAVFGRRAGRAAAQAARTPQEYRSDTWKL